MRYAIVADIHANLAAFTAVLVDIEHRGEVDELWCLVDVVGYGPDPHECIVLLSQTNHVCVAGNHDWAAIGKLDTSEFNPDAATACHWTAQQLNREDKNYLNQLPQVIQKGSIIAKGTISELRVTAQTGLTKLEDIFLELTGGQEMKEVIEFLKR